MRSGAHMAMHAPCAVVHFNRAGTVATGVTPKVAPAINMYSAKYFPSTKFGLRAPDLTKPESPETNK
jgi:hypothetical protein